MIDADADDNGDNNDEEEDDGDHYGNDNGNDDNLNDKIFSFQDAFVDNPMLFEFHVLQFQTTDLQKGFH